MNLFRGGGAKSEKRGGRNGENNVKYRQMSVTEDPRIFLSLWHLQIVYNKLISYDLGSLS